MTVSSIDPATAQELAAAAGALLESLEPEQRAAAQVAPDDTRRLRDWHYFPRLDQPGLLLARMDEAQRAVAHRLLSAALSERGAAQARTIMALEEIVAGLEGSDRYDPNHYAFVLFGTPSLREPWGWRVDGHHLSITMVATPDGDLTVTPHFMGANPAVVHEGPQAGTKALAREMDQAFDLLHGLEDSERAKAVIADRSMGDVLAGPGAEDRLNGPPEGLPLADLNEARREAVIDLVRTYADRLRPDLAHRELARVREAGPEALHFAWAGSHQPGKPHYYRITGPTLVIEYDCTQDDANHVHTVWHDPGRDFGEDPLKRHYHHGHHAR